MADLQNTEFMRYLIERMKHYIEIEINKRKRESIPYEPVCPRGYLDCTQDPAYIKHYHPQIYSQLYGDVDPKQAVYERDGCCEIMHRDPEENHYCYDPDGI
jgi:hypothetical protein